MTVAEYCGGGSCELDRSRVCRVVFFNGEWARGCGYIRVGYTGDVGDSGLEIWDDESGALIYDWYFGGTQLAGNCHQPTIVGTMPTCDDWAPACPMP
jgi:hypothetical protein